MDTDAELIVDLIKHHLETTYPGVRVGKGISAGEIGELWSTLTIACEEPVWYHTNSRGRIAIRHGDLIITHSWTNRKVPTKRLEVADPTSLEGLERAMVEWLYSPMTFVSLVSDYKIKMSRAVWAGHPNGDIKVWLIDENGGNRKKPIIADESVFQHLVQSEITQDVHGEFSGTIIANRPKKHRFHNTPLQGTVVPVAKSTETIC